MKKMCKSFQVEDNLSIEFMDEDDFNLAKNPGCKLIKSNHHSDKIKYLSGGVDDQDHESVKL